MLLVKTLLENNSRNPQKIEQQMKQNPLVLPQKSTMWSAQGSSNCADSIDIEDFVWKQSSGVKQMGEMCNTQ